MKSILEFFKKLFNKKKNKLEVSILKYVEKNIDGIKSIVFNCSDGFENWSQRNSKYEYKKGNNLINWLDLCNVHAYTDALAIAGYKLYSSKYPELERFPDKLAKYLCESKEVDDFYKSKAYACWEEWNKGEKDSYSPCEVHQVLAYGVNTFLGHNNGSISNFNAKCPISDIIKNICIDNMPIVTSGKFCNMNHMVCIVGVIFDNFSVSQYLNSEDSFMDAIRYGKIKPTHIIIDDPYGDMNTNYNNKVGNDIVIPYDKFIAEVKPLNDKTVKYAHYFNGAIATV